VSSKNINGCERGKCIVSCVFQIALGLFRAMLIELFAIKKRSTKTTGISIIELN
jgi:hypothetical protein